MPRVTMKNKMNRLITVIVCGTALLTAVAVVIGIARPPPKPQSGASTKGLARSESVSAGERRGRDGSPSRPQWCAVDVASALHCGALGERALPFVALGSICCLLLPVLLSDSHFLRGFCRAEIGCAA